MADDKNKKPATPELDFSDIELDTSSLDFSDISIDEEAEPVKKKDVDFGKGLPALGQPSAPNSTTDRLKPRITFDDPQVQKLTKLKTDQNGNPVRIGDLGVKLFSNGRAQSPDGKHMGYWDLVDGKIQYKFEGTKAKAPVRKQNPNAAKSDATDVRTPKPVMKYATPKAATGDEGFETGLFRGLQGYDQGTKYANVLLNESREERIKFASGEFAKAQARNQELANRGQMDQETPMMSWTGFGELLGGVLKPIVATVGANMAAPVAGTATAVVMGMHNGAGSAYQRAFTEAKAKGMTDDMADDVAIKMSGIGAVAGAAENLIGVKTGPAMKALESIGTKVTKRAGAGKAIGIAGEATSDAVVGAGLQFGQNVAQNSMGLETDLSAGVVENAMGEYIFGAVGAGATTLKFAHLNIKGKLNREDAKIAIQEKTFAEIDAAIPENPEEPITDTSIRTPLQARQKAQELAKENGYALEPNTSQDANILPLAAGIDPIKASKNNPLHNEPNEIAWKLMNQDVQPDDIDDLELQKSYEWMQEVANRIDHLDPEERAMTLSELADGMEKAQEILDYKLANKKPDIEDQVEDMRTGAAPIGKVRKDAYGDVITPRQQGPINPAEVNGQQVVFNGKPAEVKIDGQLVEIHQGDTIHELGNVESVTDLSKHGVTLTEPEVEVESEPDPIPFKFEGKVNDDYSVEVRGKKYTNRYSDKASAINRNAEGKAISVTLDTEDGKKRTFTDKNIVQHIAEQYHAIANPIPKPKPGKVNEPNPHIAEIAKKYAPDTEVDDTLVEKLDVDNSKAIADAYEAMEHNPEDPETKAAYQAMKDETKKQWDILAAEGYVFEPWEGEGEPYASSADMARDLKENKHLWFFQTEKGFGESDETFNSNPLTEPSGVEVNGKNLLYNDLFRAVHDAFGHGKLGNQFGAVGEENAWRTHVQMYSPAARRAVTTETRGQNSWVNFGPHMRNADGTIKKKGDEGFMGVRERPFADQKVGLLPEEFSSLDGKKPEPIVDNTPAEPVKPVSTTEPVKVKPKSAAKMREEHKAAVEKKFATPDEQIAAGKERLRQLFSGKQLNDVGYVTKEMALAIGEIAVGYARKGMNTAADFVKIFRTDFPDADIEDKELVKIFNQSVPKTQIYGKPLKSENSTGTHENTKRLDPENNDIHKKIAEIGTGYQKIAGDQSVEKAQAVIKAKGLETAAKMVTNPDGTMFLHERASLAVEVAREYTLLYAKTGDIKHLNAASKAHILGTDMGEDAARTLSNPMKALAEMMGTTPEGAKILERTRAAQARDNSIEKIADLEAKLAEAEKVKNELEAQIANIPVEIKPEDLVPAPKKRISFSAKSKASIASWFDSFKIPEEKNALHDVTYLIGAKIRNGAVEAAKQAFLMGYSIKEAVSKAVGYVNINHTTTWNQTDFEADLETHISKAAAEFDNTPAKQIAEKVLDYIADTEHKQLKPITKMISILFKKATDHLPAPVKNKPLSAAEKIQFVLDNYDVMREQLKAAQTELMNWTPTITDPVLRDKIENDIAEFLMAFTKFPWSRKETQTLVKAKAKELGVDFKKIAFNPAEETYVTKAIIDGIIADMGLTGDAAVLVEGAAKETIYKAISDEFNKVFTNDRVAEKVTKQEIFRPTGDAKKDAVELRKRVRELAAGHFTDREATKQTLPQRLITELGLGPDMANSLATVLKQNFDRLIAKEQAKFLADKTKMKSMTPRQKKTFIDRLVEASNMGALDNQAFRDAFAAAHGIPVLTNTQWQKLDHLADRIQDLNKRIEAKDQDAEEASKELMIVNKAITDIKAEAPLFADVYISSMQLGTLGLKSAGVNFFGNLMNTPQVILNNAIEALIDRIASATIKNHVRTTAFRASAIGAWKALPIAAKETAFHIVHGTTSDPISDMHRSFGFLRGLRNAKNKNLTFSQRAGGAWEALTTPVSKTIAKLLTLGDTPFRVIARHAAAYRLGHLQGLRGKELEKFAKFPPKEFEDLIRYAADYATFQQRTGKPDGVKGFEESVTNKITSAVTQAPEEAEKLADKYLGDYVGSFIKILVKASGALYVRIPMNLARRAISLGMPELHAAAAVKNLAKGNNERAVEHLSKFVTGLVLHTAIGGLLKAGLMTASDDDDTPKERAAGASGKKANSINMTALLDPSRYAMIVKNMIPGITPEPIPEEADDWWMEYSKIPVMGPIMMAKADLFEMEETRYGDLVSYNFGLAKGMLDQGIFMGTFAFLEAIKEPGNRSDRKDRFAAGLFETLTNPVFPKVLKEASMTTDEWKRDTSGDIPKRIEAIMVQRLKALPLIDADRLPKKIGPWGEPIPVGSMGSYDPTGLNNPDESTLTYRLLELSVKNNDDRYLPPVPSKTLNGVKMTEKQYEEYCILLGKKRLAILSGVPKLPEPGMLQKIYGHTTAIANLEFARKHPDLAKKR